MAFLSIVAQETNKTLSVQPHSDTVLEPYMHRYISQLELMNLNKRNICFYWKHCDIKKLTKKIILT